MTTATEPLYEFTSHIEGKNAQVRLYRDRIEWSRRRLLGGSAGAQMIPLRTVGSVSTKRDGMFNTLVQVASASGVVSFRVSHAEAATVMTTLNRLLTEMAG